MSPFKHDVSDLIRERPDKNARDSKSSGLISDSWDWLKNNIVNPVHNTAWAQPVNALRNIVNPVTNFTFGTDLIGKQNHWQVKTADSIGIDWAVQNISSGLGAMVPYIIAGKVMGGSMRAGGRMLQMEGGMAKVFASERLAMVAGAAAYDGLRDPMKGETRFSNAAGGAAAFLLLGKGNEIAATKRSFITRTAFRLGTGAAAADAQVIVGDLAQGKLPDEKTVAKLGDASTGGAAMNILLPWAHGKLTAGTDRVNTALGRGIPVERFIQQEGLATREFANLQGDAQRNPLSRVQISQENSPKFRKNIAHIDERIVDATAKIRAEQEAHKAAKGEPSKSAEEIRKEALAAELRAELGDIEAGKAGKAGSVLSNRDIVKALKDGRLQVSLPKEVAGKTVYEPVELEKLLPQIGTNTLDLTLGDTFVYLPKGRTIDLGKEHPADFLRTLPVERHPEGILLKPGEFVLAFSQEKITMPSETKANWNGEPPLKGRINVQSSLARLGIPENITAPEVNNNTNNPITHEIKNNGDVTVRLVPGMRFGSVVFERLSGPPGLGFQQSRMHGQERPNGAQGPSTGSVEQIVTANGHPNGEIRIGLGHEAPAVDLTQPRFEPVNGTAGQHTNGVPREGQNGRTHESHTGNGRATAGEPTQLRALSSFGSAEQFSQHMDGLRRAYSESIGRHEGPTNYTKMRAAELKFAEETLRGNPSEWDRYINGLKANPSRQSDYLQALQTERAAMCKMEIGDLLKIPDSSRVHDALKLLNDPTKAGEFRRALAERRPDADAMARIHDQAPDNHARPDNGRTADAQRETTTRQAADERPRQSVTEIALSDKPADPRQLPGYLEQLRIAREQLKTQGQELMSMQAIIGSAEREFAAHALKSNPQAWYDYVDALKRNPLRQMDYASSCQTERFVLQHMEPIDLIKIESSRVMQALSAMNDKTKLTAYMRMSSDTRYTLSPDALSRIHDMPPDSHAPASGQTGAPRSDQQGSGFFAPKRRSGRYDEYIRDLVRRRNRGNLNGGMSDGTGFSAN